MSGRDSLHEWSRFEKEFADILRNLPALIARVSLGIVGLTKQAGSMGLDAWSRTESNLKSIGSVAKKLVTFSRSREWLALRANYPPHLVLRNGVLQCSACGQPFSRDLKPSLSRLYAEHVYTKHRMRKTQKTARQ
jgi:hypothetical protein